MKEKPFVVYWNGTGTNTHHYFKTFDEARKYVLSNSVPGIVIAKVLAHKNQRIIRLENI